MKGYVNVSRSDVIAAITGYALKRDAGKELIEKCFDMFYENKYTNGSWFTRLRYRNKTKRGFAYTQLPMFGDWGCIFGPMLSSEERDLLIWYIWTNGKLEGLENLLKLCQYDDTLLVDDEMAKCIITYKDYLENLK